MRTSVGILWLCSTPFSRNRHLKTNSITTAQTTIMQDQKFRRKLRNVKDISYIKYLTSLNQNERGITCNRRPPFSSLDHQQTTKRFAKRTLAPTTSYWNVLANQINPRVCQGGQDNNEPASNRRTLERDSHDISPCVNHPATAVSCRRQLDKTFGI